MRYDTKRMVSRAYVCMVCNGLSKCVGGKISSMNAESNDCIKLFSNFMGTLRYIIYS